MGVVETVSGEWFKVSVIDGAIELARYLSEHQEVSEQTAVRYLRSNPATSSYHFDTAQELAGLIGWDAFQVSGTRKAQLAKVLLRVTMRLMPAWARAAHRGRRVVHELLTNNEVQCLRYAGLLETPMGEDATEWWRSLSHAARSLQQERQDELGRTGEEMSLEFERKKLSGVGLDLSPKWVSAEDSSLGYDILSYEVQGEKLQEVYIEAKACAYGPTRFFLSRNEWRVASENRGRYWVHVWNLEDGTLRQLSAPELMEHIPADAGQGRWETVCITLV